MVLRKWEDLPENMQCDEVQHYYDVLSKHKGSLILKRIFDIVVSAIMLIILSPVFLVIAVAIAVDSPGSVFFKQVRVTKYGREFRIFKFRTMVTNAEKFGAQITSNHDVRVTSVGKVLRRYRLDEIPQLLNILTGDMTFVGTRPEIPRFVAQYSPEMLATLLLPAGVTSEASIYYKDENRLLDAAEDVNRTYVEAVLPGKMHYNLKAIKESSFWHDIKIMFQTVFAVLGKSFAKECAVETRTETVVHK